MKSLILRVGLFTCLIFLGWSYEQASADTSLPLKCASLGEIKPNQNPNPQQINCLLTNAALEANIPPEVVKAVAAQESDWRQFADGQPFISQDGGIGIMQITNQSSYDPEKLKQDIYYNIQAGVEILSSSYNRSDLPKIKDAGRDVIENWYFSVMAYNGTKPVNSPLFQKDGAKNTSAYQEKVFALLKQDSFLNGTELAQFPFSTADFDYQPNSDLSIKFNKLEYTITDQMHDSTYLLQTGDKVVTKDDVNFRSKPDSNSSYTKLGKNTTLTIDGDFLYDQSNGNNRFVWYPVKTADQKLGYISSAYLTKKLDAPVVSPVDDNDVSLSGKAPFANVMIQIMNGTLPVGSTLADTNGDFKVEIPAQQAGTQLTVTYKNKLNEISPAATISVVQHYVPNGWISQNSKRYHYTNGVLNTGWYNDGGNYYYLDPNNGGAMKTGWLTINNQTFYLNPQTGVKTTSAWVTDSGKKYHFNAFGVMEKGWSRIGSYWYYFNTNGTMATGWLKDGNSWYYLGANGVMQTGWVKYNSEWYYLANNGKMVTGWLKINGKWYYFYSNGKMAHDTKIGKYRLGHSGAMI